MYKWVITHLGTGCACVTKIGYDLISAENTLIEIFQFGLRYISSLFIVTGRRSILVSLFVVHSIPSPLSILILSTKVCM